MKTNLANNLRGCEQVCVQLPTYADNVALPAFAHRAHSSKPAARCCSGRMGQTNGKTQYRFIEPARAIPIIY